MASATDNSKHVRGNEKTYIESLTKPDRDRYFDKLKHKYHGKEVSIQDPYKTWDDTELWSNSPTSWPDIAFGDIYQYLVETPGPFSSEKLKAYKSMDAYNYFVSRKVGCILVNVVEGTDLIIVKSEVRPGQAETRDSHLPWIVSKKTGEIVIAHCDCKAGLGETCSHIAAVAFKIEAAVRIGLTKASCTSEACRWNQVFGNNSLTQPADEIDFKPSKRKENNPRQPTTIKNRKPLAAVKGDGYYLEAYRGFLESLEEIAPDACIFKSLPKLDEERTDTADSENVFEDHNMSDTSTNDDNDHDDAQDEFQVVCLPHCTRTEIHPRLPQNPPAFPLNGNVLKKYTDTDMSLTLSIKSIDYYKLLNTTYDSARTYEAQTRKQADCAKWHELRKPRLTASNFGKVCTKMDNPRARPQALASKMLQPNAHTTFVERMMKWGRDNEVVAVQVYKSLSPYKHTKVYTNGIFVSPEEPFLAATPDRVCYDCTEDWPWGLIEVKCPYKARERTPTQAATEISTFCSTLSDDGELHLKQNHEYFYQVQGQMAMTGAKWCDFVLYTKHGIAVERIYFDSDFWKSKVVLLHDFFFEHFLPMYITIQEA